MCAGVNWQTQLHSLGQLRLDDKTDLLVWSKAERPITIQQKLDAIEIGTLPTEDLVTFCHASEAIHRRPQVSRRRADIFSEPSGGERASDEPRRSNRVRFVNIDAVDAAFDLATTADGIREIENVMSGISSGANPAGGSDGI